MDAASEIEVRLEEEGGHRVVHLQGELCLPNTGRVQRALMEGLATGQETVLDGAGVTAIDLAGLQLLCSAHRTYRRHGANFDLRSVPQGLQETARAAGYRACESICPFREDGICLWRY